MGPAKGVPNLAQVSSLPRVRGSGVECAQSEHIPKVKAGEDAQDAVISQETSLYKAFCGGYGSGRIRARVNLEALETGL